ncbi:MAG: hypothetical protein WD602_05630 [Actinomycetota bacterium]
MSDTEVPEQSMSEQLGFSGPEEEREAINAKMAEIKEAVTEELIRDWPSPWKSENMVGAKVTGRLSSHKAYQTLMARRRELDAQLGIVGAARQAEEAQDPMGSYAAKIRKSREEPEEGAER